MKKIKHKTEIYCPKCKKFVKSYDVSIFGSLGYKSGLKGRGGLPFKRCRKCGEELMELSKMKK
jgi:phage FluMu protein Com